MQGRAFLMLFCLPFAGIGVWAGWSIASTLYDGWQMADWTATEARILEGGYHSHSGDDSTSYEAYATYRYRVAGEDYTNDRVGLDKGADNIGDYQESIGRRLQNAAAQAAVVTIYVNPDAPEESVVFRDIRWGLLSFKGVFLLVFGGFGFGLMAWSMRAATPKDVDDPAFRDEPWLQNDRWQAPQIRSGSRAMLLGAWAFAGFWNLISMPLPFLLVDEVTEKANYAALIGLIFPIIGLGLLAWAVRRTREWRRFGATPVTLDPFPGAIGGHVGGNIDVGIPYRSDMTAGVTLTSIRRSTSGSGKNRRRNEKAIWQDDARAAIEPGPKGTRLLFRFDVPAGLEASDAAPDRASSVAWKLNVAATLPGVDLDRDYEIPVYPTGGRSTTLPEGRLQEASKREDRADEDKVRRQLNITQTASGRQIHFPPGRNLGMATSVFLFGAGFAAIGWFLLMHEGETFMGVIFGGIGLMIAIAMLYTALNSLTVSVSAGTLTAVRRIAGIAVSRRTTRIDQIDRLAHGSTFQTQSGGKHVMHYTVRAHDRSGNQFTLAEGLKGEGDARAAMRLISSELGLRSALGSRSRAAPGDVDVLADDG